MSCRECRGEESHKFDCTAGRSQVVAPLSHIREVAHILPPDCQHLSTWFDRSLCAEPCGRMHVICYRCQRPVDECVFLTEEGER